MNPALAPLAAKALDLVPDGARIGLGSGRAAEAFLHALAERVRAGFRVRGVPTSEPTARLAQSLGVPLDTLDDAEPLAVTIDGADEVERRTLNLIKGLGGALVRERIVAAAARMQVILVTPEKLVDRLGDHGVVPVEVLPFAEPYCRRQLAALGLWPVLRSHDGTTFVTDNGNWILDCGMGRMTRTMGRLEDDALAIPGVVDTGLFLGTASLVLVGRDGDVEGDEKGMNPPLAASHVCEAASGGLWLLLLTQPCCLVIMEGRRRGRSSDGIVAGPSPGPHRASRHGPSARRPSAGDGRDHVAGGRQHCEGLAARVAEPVAAPRGVRVPARSQAAPRPTPYLPLDGIRLTDGVGHTLFEEYAGHRAEARGDEETGWVLLGLREATQAVVLATLPAGGQREASVSHVRFNSIAQAVGSRIVRQADRRLTILGVVHTHPGSLRHPSDGDYAGDRQWVQHLRGREGVFGIGTADAQAADTGLFAEQPRPHVQTMGELRLSWYSLRAGARPIARCRWR